MPIEVAVEGYDDGTVRTFFWICAGSYVVVSENVDRWWP